MVPTLDGSVLEGGGQLVRVGLCLSALCRIPIKIYSIRANRASKGRRQDGKDKGRSGKASSSRPEDEKCKGTSSGGGLKESHLAALNWLADATNAKVEGGLVGSCHLEFTPRWVNPPRVDKSGQSDLVESQMRSLTLSDESESFHKVSSEESRTADPIVHESTITLERPGSVWLIFQALYPFIALSKFPVKEYSGVGRATATKVVLNITGGTNTSNSMSSEYVQQVFLPICESIGLPKVDVEIVKRGWAGSRDVAEMGQVRVTIWKNESLGLESDKKKKTEEGEPVQKVSGEIDSADDDWELVDNSDSESKPADGEPTEENVMSPSKDAQEAVLNSPPSTSSKKSSPSHPPRLLPSLRQFTLAKRGHITQIDITILAGSQPEINHLRASIEHKLQYVLFPMLADGNHTPKIVDHSLIQSSTPRHLYVLLVAHTSNGHRLGRDFLGGGSKATSEAKQNMILDAAAKHVVNALKHEIEHGGVVDEFMQDQLVIFQALAGGVSAVECYGRAQAGSASLGPQADTQGDDGAVETNTKTQVTTASMSRRQEEEKQKGTLHAQTVRWVCSELLGTAFAPFPAPDFDARGPRQPATTAQVPTEVVRNPKNTPSAASPDRNVNSNLNPNKTTPAVPYRSISQIQSRSLVQRGLFLCAGIAFNPSLDTQDHYLNLWRDRDYARSSNSISDDPSMNLEFSGPTLTDKHKRRKLTMTKKEKDKERTKKETKEKKGDLTWDRD